MSQNSSPLSSMQQLSIGNVVTVSLQLYRANLKLYFKLSLVAYLWLLVPLYGWANFLAIYALISRLAFNELIDFPESVKAASLYVKRRRWSFLLKSTLLMIVLFISLVLSFIVTAFCLELIGRNQFLKYLGNYLFENTIVRRNAWIALVIALVMLLVLFAALFIPTLWLYSHFFLTDIPLALENKVNFLNTFIKSWRLTSQYSFRIQLILLIVSLILGTMETLIYLICNITILGMSKILNLIVYPEISGYSSLFIQLAILAMILLNLAIMMPVLQVLKAVVYYNLRLRREGVGLQLQPRTI